jgi:hypothetical protein
MDSESNIGSVFTPRRTIPIFSFALPPVVFVRVATLDGLPGEAIEHSEFQFS